MKTEPHVTEKKQPQRRPARLLPERPALLLAPMEGVTDAPMRALLCELGGFDLCVGEFLRVTSQVPPHQVFFRHIPELAHQSRTPDGTPVVVQLLGGDGGLLAETAVRAVELGAEAIDLNFGCPAKTVNRHDGGAALLLEPARIRSIVAAVRAQVPRHIPVSAKLRLGWDDPTSVLKTSEEAAIGGADWLTIHGRTKVQGYRPWALWKPIGAVRRQLGALPVVANGDLWDVPALIQCQQETGCTHFMVGRGALARPFEMRAMAVHLGVQTQVAEDSSRRSLAKLMRGYAQRAQAQAPRSETFLAGRLKQWGQLAWRHGDAPWYEQIKRLKTAADIAATVEAAEATRP